MTDFYNVVDEPLGKTTFIDADDVAQRLRICGYDDDFVTTIDHILEYLTECYQYGADVHVYPASGILHSGVYCISITDNNTNQYDLDDIYTLATIVDNPKSSFIYDPAYYMLFLWLSLRHKIIWPQFEAMFDEYVG